MARHKSESSDTLETNIYHVCQMAAPQVTQLWYKKFGNTSLWDKTVACLVDYGLIVYHS